MDENTPRTEPGGALIPPPDHAAVIAASTSQSPQRLRAGQLQLRESLRGLVDAVLDRLDVAADRIADATGLR